MSDTEETLSLEVPESDAGPVSALLLKPQAARWLLALAHGAGAGMEHPFLETLARRLAERGVATLRYRWKVNLIRQRMNDAGWLWKVI